MPRCPFCAHEYEASERSTCPSCGKSESLGPTTKKPAHLSVLEVKPNGNGAKSSQEAKPLVREHARGRIVSTAGPALPVRKHETDSVPSSWLSRLEAARMMTSAQHVDLKQERAAPTAPPPLKPQAPVRPPPSVAPQPASPPTSPPTSPSASTPASPSAPQSAPGLTAKPAHVLVAELEAHEKQRRDREQARLQQLMEPQTTDEISGVEIKLEEPKKRKRWIPDWLIVAVLGVGVAGGVYGVYSAVKEEPAPVVRIDPKLLEAKAKRERAMSALQKGHELALAGASKADEAIAAYQKALELEPTLAGAERGLAIAYTAKEDKARAVEHYERYLVLDPKAADAKEVQTIIDGYRKAKAAETTPTPTPPPAPTTKSPPPKRRRANRERN